MPAISRDDLDSSEEARTYRCVSRCVRHAFLCGQDDRTGRDYEHRKQWLIDRLRFLASVFAIEVGPYTIMDKHYEVHLTLRPGLVSAWGDTELVERWWRLYPRKGEERLPDGIRQAWLADADFLGIRRQRLVSLSWFMRCLNEPFAKRANREDGVVGCFWQGRFLRKRVLGKASAQTGPESSMRQNPLKAERSSEFEETPPTPPGLHARSLLRNSPLRLRVPLKLVLARFDEEAPYLLEDATDYMEPARNQALALLVKNETKLVMKPFLSRCGFAVAARACLENEAAIKQRKALKVLRAAQRLLAIKRLP